jgi:hypothetical protein
LLPGPFGCNQAGNLIDDALELADHSALNAGFKDPEQLTKVPELVLWSALEATPDGGPDYFQIVQDGSCVVELVGDRNDEHVFRLGAQAREIGILSFIPALFLVVILGERVG